jgi:GNAT superfamily N-acetyltransferase
MPLIEWNRESSLEKSFLKYPDMSLQKTAIIEGFVYSTEKDRLDLDYIHSYLSERSYWAQGIPREVTVRSIENSFCVAVYHDEKQVGFARLVTDYATFGYLADVFIDENFRGRSLSKNLMDFIFSFEEIAKFRRLTLVTRDAHTLYARYGFEALAFPDRYMELHRPNIYKG